MPRIESGLLLLAAVAVLGLSANKLCFSRFDLAWLIMVVIVGVVVLGVVRRRITPRLATWLFVLVAVWEAGWFVQDVIRYGTCLHCPTGSWRTGAGNYWGSWTVCKRSDGMPLGPAMGTTFSEGGTATDHFQEYRRIGNKLVGLEVGCGVPRQIEVCMPDGDGHSCHPAYFDPPLQWTSCSNLSGVVGQGFERGCQPGAAPPELCP
jgi:hypothetical protein